MTSPARAGRTLVAAKPTAVARNALPKLVGPSGSSRYCQRQARITRFRNIVRSDRVSQSNRAWTISRATPRRSTLYNTSPSNAAASASTIKVRKCDRMNDRNVSYYTALARSTRVRRYMLLLSAWKHPCNMRGSASEGMLLPLAAPVLNTTLARRPPDRQGKVRDIYDLGDHLLIVATDRLSAFDCVLGSGIPDKGKVLSQISAFWFDRTLPIVPNHVLSTDINDVPGLSKSDAAALAGRSMLVRKAEPLPIECVARGYLSGSGWKDYITSGEVCGIKLPEGLLESSQLPEPIFTPATKAQSGHDINISVDDAGTLVDPDVLDRARELTLQLYAEGAAHAESVGIIVADTKFEFGLLPEDGRAARDRLILIDEVLTPDSSRFWPADSYAPGGPQPSYAKQFVRDYLERIKWNKQPPVPSLPDDVVLKTRDKYVEAFS